MINATVIFPVLGAALVVLVARIVSKRKQIAVKYLRSTNKSVIA
tara:strand:+ start:270 stop:401 length:132 start_codon:yes stop_codon:yes gene_type:complete